MFMLVAVLRSARAQDRSRGYIAPPRSCAFHGGLFSRVAAFLLSPRRMEGICLGIVAVLLPPLAVASVRGAFTPSFWVSVLLTLIGWLPGQVYALYIVCTNRRIVAAETDFIAAAV